MKNPLLLGAIALLVLPALATAQATTPWCEDFDAYGNGTGIIGQGDWEGWAGDPTPDAFVSDMQANSAPHSLGVIATSDVVVRYTENAGQWTFTAWQYFPANTTGQSFFIMLNTYILPAAFNWSVQLACGNGVIESQFEALTLPLIMDQWVEIRCEINLDIDDLQIFYGGNLLSQKSWAEGVSGGGALAIGAVDLFGNGADTVFYDDMSLGDCVTAVEQTSWGSIKNVFK